VFEHEQDNPPDLTDESSNNTQVWKTEFIPRLDKDGRPIDSKFTINVQFIVRTFPFKVLALTGLASIYSELSASPVSTRKNSNFIKFSDEIYALIIGSHSTDPEESMARYAKEYRHTIAEYL
jgi:hypothetical protein